MAYSFQIEQTILKYSELYGVDANLIRVIIRQESGGSPNALGDYDSEGVPHSFGLMQLNDKGAGKGYFKEYLLEIDNNVNLGTKYLKACLDAFPGDLRTGISAYNQGIANARSRGWTHNRRYVESVLSYYGKPVEEEEEEREAIPQGVLAKITPSDSETKDLWKATFDRIASGCSLYFLFLTGILSIIIYFILR